MATECVMLGGGGKKIGGWEEEEEDRIPLLCRKKSAMHTSYEISDQKKSAMHTSYEISDQKKSEKNENFGCPAQNPMKFICAL